MKVKIIKCSYGVGNGEGVYSKEVGEIKTVEECNCFSAAHALPSGYKPSDFYIVAGTGTLFLKTDCVNWDEYDDLQLDMFKRTAEYNGSRSGYVPGVYGYKTSIYSSILDSIPGAFTSSYTGTDPFKGESREFDGGAKRDSNKGKIRPDLISPIFLKALGEILRAGSEKYGDRNWEKNMPQEVLMESASRHYVQWMNGETDEDHAGHLAFNLMAWIHFRDKK